MRKQDMAIVALLFLALLGWMVHQNRIGRARLAALEEERRQRQVLSVEASTSAALGAATGTAAEAPAPGEPREVAATPEAEPVASAPEALETPTPREPETCVTLHTDELVVTVSSRGGAVADATLLNYPETLDAESGPVAFDFERGPALRWEGLPGVAADADYTLAPDADGRGVTLALRSAQGLAVERRIVLRERYQVEIADRLVNTSDRPLALAPHWLTLGVFHGGASKNDTLGVDSAEAGGEAKVRHWERDITRALTGGGGGFGCFGGGSSGPIQPRATLPVERPQRWVAVKSRFFTQIFLSSAANAGFRIEAGASAAGVKGNPVGSVAAAVAFEAQSLQPGGALERVSTLYIGPKKLDYLTALGPDVGDVMAFGTFKWVCKLLVPTLNFFYGVFRNYGVAVILLTLLVRVIFWPLTHKSTESMKRMQSLQPQLKALQAQHKDNPQKLQQETWRIYRENKVNPLSSCLPMLVQIPIFIALFTVLRSAVELRYAPFLWIADLSEPENLLAGVLPIPLNILPILMAATMGLQSYLTPSMGDPAQQKMMMILMPGMMLFMFYSMPAALSLYWTVSQGVSIIQMLMQRYRNAKKQEGEAAAVVEPADVATRQMRRRQSR